MLDNCVAVVNSNGGVGKTSIVANVAATAALGGWRTLAVDLDAQGNLAGELGYRDRSDEGDSLLEAVMTASRVQPMSGVRAGLDGDLCIDPGEEPFFGRCASRVRDDAVGGQDFGAAV